MASLTVVELRSLVTLVKLLDEVLELRVALGAVADEVGVDLPLFFQFQVRLRQVIGQPDIRLDMLLNLLIGLLIGNHQRNSQPETNDYENDYPNTAFHTKGPWRLRPELASPEVALGKSMTSAFGLRISTFQLRISHPLHLDIGADILKLYP